MTANYWDRETFGAQIQASRGMHRNGRVYDEHPIINTLNEMVAHFEAGEITELATYFTDDAEFYRLGVEGNLNLEERTATWHQAVATNSVRDLEQSGYPDAIYYSLYTRKPLPPIPKSVPKYSKTSFRFPAGFRAGRRRAVGG